METTGKDFIEFWSWASDKGGMNKNTANSLATAVKQVIYIEENWQTIDVNSLDVNKLLLRFQNARKKEFTPESLHVYERRFKQALGLFLDYQRDPVNWKYKSQASNTRKTNMMKHRNLRSPESDGDSFGSQHISNVPMVDYPYPLRENCIVRIKLPIDLRISDVDRLSSFLRTLVVDSNQSIK